MQGRRSGGGGHPGIRHLDHRSGHRSGGPRAEHGGPPHRSGDPGTGFC